MKKSRIGFDMKWVFLILAVSCQTFDAAEKRRLLDKTLEMFDHAFTSYMKNAYPADELMPLSCKGRTRGKTPSRGDVDDALGNFQLTLVDALDTLAFLGRIGKF